MKTRNIILALLLLGVSALLSDIGLDQAREDGDLLLLYTKLSTEGEIEHTQTATDCRTMSSFSSPPTPLMPIPRISSLTTTRRT